MLTALTTALADPETTPLQAMLHILAGELDNLISWLKSHRDYAWA